MKKIYVLFLLLAAFACNKEDSQITVSNTTNNPAQNGPVAGILTGKWKLVAYTNLVTGTVITEPTDITRSVIIDFLDDGSKGTLQGLTIANSVGGTYELSVVGEYSPGRNKMKTLFFAGTKVGEPSWGGNFWDSMLIATSCERTNDKMFIYFNSDTQRMEFEKK
jgi:hypothetical protein